MLSNQTRAHVLRPLGDSHRDDRVCVLIDVDVTDQIVDADFVLTNFSYQ